MVTYRLANSRDYQDIVRFLEEKKTKYNANLLKDALKDPSQMIVIGISAFGVLTGMISSDEGQIKSTVIREDADKAEYLETLLACTEAYGKDKQFRMISACPEDPEVEKALIARDYVRKPGFIRADRYEKQL